MKTILIENKEWYIPDKSKVIGVLTETKTDYKTAKELEKDIAQIKKQMERASKDLDFIEAARLRDIMLDLKKKIK